MAKPKKNVKLNESKTKKKTTVVKVSSKSKVKKSKTKKAVEPKIKHEDKSYDNLASVEPMFGKELKEEIIEQVHTEMELEEKTTMLKVATSIIISTVLTVLLYFIINLLVPTTWNNILPVLIIIWIITTLLSYLLQSN